MAIVKMTSFQLFTFKENKDRLLKALQKFGYVDFTNLSDELNEEKVEESTKAPPELLEVTEHLDKVKNAIKLISPFDIRPKGLKGMEIGNPNLSYEELDNKFKEIPFEETLKKVKTVSDVLDELNLKETKLRSEIDELSVWTDLDIGGNIGDKLKNAEGFFIQVSKKNEVTLYPVINKLENTYIEKVGETKNEFIYLILTDKDDLEPLMEGLKANAYSEVRPDFTEAPHVIRKRLEEEIIALKKEEKETKERLASLAPELPGLEMVYESLENRKKRIEASELGVTTKYLDAITGYIPESKKEVFENRIKESIGEDFSLKFTEVDKDNPEVPVLLKNGKFVSAFESITNMYATPKYNEIDPTPFLAPFYTFFFGMMIGDAVYGLILLIISSIALKKFNLSKSMRSFMQFFFYLSFPTIFWGVMYGSYLSLDVPIPKVIDPANQIQLLLIMSIGFGVVHLFFGLALKAYILIRDGKPMDAILDVFLWYLTLTGAAFFLLAGPLGLPAIVGTVAKYGMFIGMIGIILFAARDAAGWGGRIAGGLYSLYGISSWVGDLVSYSRLMALGLSGAFIGMAFNMIAGMVNTAWYMVPFAIIIFLVGHLFNIFLSALGSYVHTLRLMYVEFFGKFYEGGGKKFQVFRQEPKYINYTDEEVL